MSANQKVKEVAKIISTFTASEMSSLSEELCEEFKVSQQELMGSFSSGAAQQGNAQQEEQSGPKSYRLVLKSAEEGSSKPKIVTLIKPFFEGKSLNDIVEIATKAMSKTACVIKESVQAGDPKIASLIDEAKKVGATIVIEEV